MAQLAKIIFVVFWVRLATALVRPFLPFDMPHVWRQIDTIAISIRYWMRWTVESESRYPLIPAVLNSMDGYGLMPMEFPLVNLLGAPFFALGPSAGRMAAMAVLIAIHFLLTWQCYRVWREKKILGFEIGNAFLLIPVIGIASTFVTKFMPDTLAMLFVLLGTGWLWDKKYVKGAALIALGVLVKPTAITVLVLLLFAQISWREKMLRCLWILPALVLAGIYYTAVLKWIATMQDTPIQFGVHARNPVQAIIDFFSAPREIFKLVFNELAFMGAPLVLVLGFPLLNSEKRRALAWLLGALSLQTFAIIVLDGDHSFIHSYYHIGTSPLIALCAVVFLSGLVEKSGEGLSRYSKAVLVLTGIAMATVVYNNLFFELRSLSSRRAERFVWPSDVSALKARNPNFPWGQAYSFRVSNQIPFPFLGVHFGEREGSSKAKYGFFLTSETPPASCREVDRARSVILVECAE